MQKEERFDMDLLTASTLESASAEPEALLHYTSD